MKFLCEQCKAKYQIADDKVAGKTVRMKCRKCGHMIEVRAEVTETSVAQGLPQDDGPKRAPPKPPAKTALATSLSARPPPPKARPDALAGAFQRKVRQEPESTASLEMLDSNTSSGWYVAINGVPVGPIRISELRRKAANGAVNEDSLAWREGLEEWRPVRSITEIAEIVREAMTSGRPSLVTPPPPEGRSSAPPPAPSMAPRAPSRPQAPRVEPPRAGQLAARNNVVPFTGRLATAEKRDEDEDIEIEEDLAFDPRPATVPATAAIAAMATPAGSPVMPERPSMIAADPFAVPGAALPVAASVPIAPAASAPIAMTPPIVVTEQARQGKPPNWIAIGMVGAFIAFGITGAIVAFRKDPVAPPPTIITIPGPAVQQQQPGVAIAPTGAIDIGPLEKAPEKTASKGATNTGKAGTQTPATPGKAGGLGLDPSLLGGPAAPGINPGGPSPAKASSELSQDQIEATVRNYSPGVKRTCWERAGQGVSSVNIEATISIASTGQVQSVNASGNEPAVAKCIENQVHNWRFPASSGTSTVKIPFKFVRQ